MVDMTALTDMHSGTAATSRIKKRRLAETRLKAYGIIAILLAAGALVALLSSVLTKAVGALTETYVTLPITLDAGELGLDSDADPRDILRADFTGLTKDALKARFPDATGRKTRRELYDLTSSGAAFELAAMVANDPAMLGETIEYPFLASDVSDLYLKGDYGEIFDKPTNGLLSVFVTDDAARLSSSVNDFSAALGRVKDGLLEQAQTVRRQAALQDNGVRFYEQELQSAKNEEDRAAAQAQLDSRTAARDALLAKADDLELRSRSASGAEDLTDENRSVMIRAGGGWFKVTRIDTAMAEADVVVQPTETIENASEWRLLVTDLPPNARKVSDNQIVWIEELREAGSVEQVFNTRFFTSGDSREPELAGIWGAVVGSFWTMVVTFALAFPIGVLAAIYLEEFAPKNKLTDFIEVNINNLAAVPSIVFGLLGLSVFLGFFGVPRSAPVAGGIVLALMTLPTIIIASRAAIRAVPPSIRDAAVGLGASPLQATFHHVLPLAMPGILTGTIIGMAQALGETAPLIMIGMVAFIVDIPTGVTDSASVLPVQVFRWSDFPERAFEARTAAAICVLLTFLVIMNALAVFLRKRFERRW